MLIFNICSFFPLVIPELQLESIFYYLFTGYKCWSNLYLPVLQCLFYKSKENRKQMLQSSHIKEKKDDKIFKNRNGRNYSENGSSRL